MRDLNLETERLLLRPFTLEDARNIYDLDDNEEVVRYVGGRSCTDLVSAPAVLQDIILPQYEKFEMGRLAVIRKDTEAFIGWCGIKYVEESDLYDLGYRFFQDQWGNGFATESAKAAMAFGHDKCRLKRIVGQADVLNVASVHVLKKVGMTFERFDHAHGGEIAVYASVR